MLGRYVKAFNRLAKRGLRLSQYSFCWRWDKAPIKPSYVSLTVADTCFFRCKHCDIWKLKPAKDRMNLDQYKLALRKIFDWLGEGPITFSGGEPFLNRDFDQIVKEANKLGFNTYVNTNGFIVNQANLDKVIKAGINGIHVSIDTLGEKHDWSRGRKGAFKKAEAAVKLIKKIKRRYKSNLEIGMTTILLKTNVGKLEELISWGEKMGVEAIYFQALSENFGKLKHDPNWFNKSKLWPDKEKAVAVIKRLIELKKAGKMIGNSVNELRDYIDYYQGGPKKFGLTRRCYVGVRNFSVAINGNVRLCYFFDSIGNILTEPPEKIWNGNKAKLQRKMIRKCKRGCRVLLCNRRVRFSLKEVFDLIKREFRN